MKLSRTIMLSSLVALLAATVHAAEISGGTVLLGAPSSAGDPYYHFTLTTLDNQFTADGNFRVDNGVIIDMTGIQNGQPLTLLPPGAYASNDNLYPLDVGGVSLTAGGIDYNIYLNGSAIWELDTPTGPFIGDGEQVKFTVTAPEPLTLSLFGAVVAGAGVAMRRRRKVSKTA